MSPALGCGRTVPDTGHARLMRAMSAAVEGVAILDAVPDDAAAAVRAPGCERLDRAFEAVEGVRAAILLDSEGLVVIVAAEVASGHVDSPTSGVWNMQISRQMRLS